MPAATIHPMAISLPSPTRPNESSLKKGGQRPTTGTPPRGEQPESGAPGGNAATVGRLCGGSCLRGTGFGRASFGCTRFWPLLQKSPVFPSAALLLCSGLLAHRNPSTGTWRARGPGSGASSPASPPRSALALGRQRRSWPPPPRPASTLPRPQQPSGSRNLGLSTGCKRTGAGCRWGKPERLRTRFKHTFTRKEGDVERSEARACQEWEWVWRGARWIRKGVRTAN